MSRGAQTFRQSDVLRALKAAKAAGIEIARVKIAKDGTIEIDFGEASKPSAAHSDSKQWDEALK